jgi:two-component system chemotaxis response regulator CheB
MQAIKQRGGITIVQDLLEAAFPSMPLSVMQDITVDYSLPLREIPPLLNRLSRETVAEVGRYPVPDEVEIESRIAEQRMGVTNSSPALNGSAGHPSLPVQTVMVLFGR